MAINKNTLASFFLGESIRCLKSNLVFFEKLFKNKAIIKICGNPRDAAVFQGSGPQDHIFEKRAFRYDHSVTILSF